MKYYVRVEESEVVNGKPVKGINSILPMIIQDGELAPHPDYIEADIELSSELLTNQSWYKWLDDEFVKMDESEMELLYPDISKEPEPTNDELLGQRITDLELALLEGGIIKI